VGGRNSLTVTSDSRQCERKSSSESSEKVFVRRWCYKCVVGQFSHGGIVSKTKVTFLSSHWSVPVSFDPSIFSQIKSEVHPVGLVHVVNESLARCGSCRSAFVII